MRALELRQPLVYGREMPEPDHVRANRVIDSRGKAASPHELTQLLEAAGIER
jgi:hypothetical protein